MWSKDVFIVFYAARREYCVSCSPNPSVFATYQKCDDRAKNNKRYEATDPPNRLVRYTSSPTTQVKFPSSEFVRDFSSLDAEGRATRVEPVTFDYSAEQTLARLTRAPVSLALRLTI